MSENALQSAKTQEGVVVSAKMDKSAIVEVKRLTRHPKYDKIIRRTTRYHAHDEANDCREGDQVRIEECRPLSKMKSWRVVEVLVRAE